jgi:predicted nucleotidyltransferase
VNPSLEQHREAVAALCRRTGVLRLGLFGSAARSDFDGARSDLDFIVEFEPLEPARLADAYFVLQDGLESLFRRRVDLITEHSLENPFFRARVLTERQPVYEAPPRG